MNIILIEIAVIAAVWLILRLLRSRIRFSRRGYVLRRDSYMQDENMRILIEDTHFWKNKADAFRSMRVDGSNLVYSRIPLDKDNKTLMVYSYCAPLLGMLRGGGVSIRRTLVLGGGGGAVPRYILENYDKSTSDLVEISAENIRMCKTYFLSEYVSGDSPRATILQADAKDAVKTLEAPYSFIFCDLYIGGQPATVVYDGDFMKEVSRLAGEKGLLVINGGSFTFQGMALVLRNLAGAFTNYWVMLLPEGYVLLAANRDLPPLNSLMVSAQGLVPIYPNLLTEAFLDGTEGQDKTPEAAEVE